MPAARVVFEGYGSGPAAAMLERARRARERCMVMNMMETRACENECLQLSNGLLMIWLWEENGGVC